jgi:RNA polymerase sigma-70 factor (ECF subfamily)
MSADKTPEFIPTSSSLLGRLKNWDDRASWQRFADTYHKLIYKTARKAGLTEAESQDVVQDTLLSVAKKMHDFKYDPALGSFKGWLLQLTGWRIKNQFKKRQPVEHLRRTDTDGSGTSSVSRVPDPTVPDMCAFWEEEWRNNLLDAAIAHVKELANPRQYEIFYLCVVKKRPVAEVTKALDVNAPQVYLAKFRVTALVKKEVRRLEKEMI